MTFGFTQRNCSSKLIRVTSLILILTSCWSLKENFLKYEDPIEDLELREDSATEKIITQAERRNEQQKKIGFEDRLFRPVLQAFKDVASGAWREGRRTSFRNGDVPKVVAYVDEYFVKRNWFSAHVKDMTEGYCPLPCTITSNLTEVKSADAIMIHLKSLKSREHLEKSLGPRDTSQPWIMFEAETHFIANTRYKVDYKTLNGVFNRTMYFRRDADVIFTHGFVVARGADAGLLPEHWVRPPALERPQAAGGDTSRVKSRMAVAFISNCKAVSARLVYIKELQRHTKVDVFGKCGKRKCGQSRYAEYETRVDKDPCLRNAAAEYLFYLAFENALCSDYATEKLYNILYYPVVPVVFGGADYDAILPPHSYIDATKFTPAKLAEKMRYLAEHPQEYESYLEWRKYYQPSTVGSSRVLCDLCTRLYDENFYETKIIDNFYNWFVTDSQCTVWRPPPI